MRMSELHAFRQMIQPYFDGVTRPALKLPDLMTSHDFETRIKGVLVTVSYQTKWCRLDCIDEIAYHTIKVYHADEDVTDWFPDDKSTGTCLRHEVEADWDRIGQEERDWS